MPQEALNLSVTEERYWALFYMPLYTFIHNLLIVLVQIANKMGLQKMSTDLIRFPSSCQWKVESKLYCGLTSCNRSFQLWSKHRYNRGCTIEQVLKCWILAVDNIVMWFESSSGRSSCVCSLISLSAYKHQLWRWKQHVPPKRKWDWRCHNPNYYKVYMKLWDLKILTTVTAENAWDVKLKDVSSELFASINNVEKLSWKNKCIKNLVRGLFFTCHSSGVNRRLPNATAPGSIQSHMGVVMKVEQRLIFSELFRFPCRISFTNFSMLIKHYRH
jgi:hypothetical protein